MKFNMQLKPEVAEFIEANRGDLSRAGFIHNLLSELAKQDNTTNTEKMISNAKRSPTKR